VLLFRSGWGLKKASGERYEVQVVRGGESEEEALHTLSGRNLLLPNRIK
jgi:hypothetical protein